MDTATIALSDSRLESVYLVPWNFISLPSVNCSSKMLIEYTCKLCTWLTAESYSVWLFTAQQNHVAW